MKSIVVEDFDLSHTLECGQFFRYEKIKDFYYVSHMDALFKLRQRDNKLLYENTTKQYLISFFRLDEDYKSIIRSISKDVHIKKAIKSLYGLRIIRQNPWECLISYICSSNANIPKIKMNLSLLSKRFGHKMILGDYGSYTFPKPGQLSHLKKIQECKVGYRARFIKQANQQTTYKKLLSVEKQDYHTAKSMLLELHGVGDKIADCVLLFSLDKLNAFPVDVWVQRVMQELYFKNKKVTKTHIREFGQNYFGKYAGYANQFLFYYRRQQK